MIMSITITGSQEGGGGHTTFDYTIEQTGNDQNEILQRGLDLEIETFGEIVKPSNRSAG
jgi:hypothetical protein